VRILLTGRTGQVGFELERVLAGFAELVPADRTKIDFTNSALIRDEVRKTKPELILNAAAYTAVDKAESEPETAMQVNGVAPGILAEEAKKLGALLVHYSTDYVFDGSGTSPYKEDDAPNPINVYGRSKLEGERRIAASGCRHLLLRTSWVYAPRGRNFFLTIAKKALAGEPLRVVSDQRGAPTEARLIAETTRALLERGQEGVFNVVPSGETSWHGFAQAIVQAVGSSVKVDAIPSSAYPTPARRPAYSVLSTGKIARALGKAPPSWESSLDRCVKEWKGA
jgi:dTDP-4-dehydrorhamnose reductase